ncbi:MAG: hypothetical protein QME42_07435 [bacterium]|nr:hypothetical protein [bacterium]
MFKRKFLGLVIVGICGLAAWAEGEEDLLSLIYERPYLEQKKARVLKEPVEYNPLFLVEGEFSQTEAKTLGMKLKATKEEKKTISMCYPKVILLKKGEQGIGKSPKQELLFLDKFGKEEKRVKMETDWADVFWSKNNKYLCVYAISKSRISKEKDKSTVFDANGNELWSFEGYPAAGYLVSPNGDYVIEMPDIDYGGGFCIVLHYANGKSKTIDLGDVVGSRPYGYYWDISENGEYFAVIIDRYLILFNKEGEALWKREGAFGRELLFFLKNQFIGAVDSRDIGDENVTEFCLYDINGNLLWKNKVFMSVQDVYYIEEEGRIYVISGWGHIFCFDVKSGELLAKYSDENAPNVFYRNPEKRPSNKSKKLLPNFRGIFITLDCSKIFTLACMKVPQLCFFEKGLKNLKEKKLSENPFELAGAGGDPIVKFSGSSYLTIMTKEGLRIYEVK